MSVPSRSSENAASSGARNAHKAADQGDPSIDANKPDGRAPPRARVESGGTPDSAPLNFDDDEIYSGRSRVREGGTTQAAGGDSGKVGPPAEQLSRTNGPSDPARRRGQS